MPKPLRVLIVEDSEEDTLLLALELQRNGYEPDYTRVETREAMQEALARREWDIVISDFVMPRFSGLEALDALKESGIDLPFIILSGNIGEDIAVEAMKAGAHDYILKGNLVRLVAAIERELREAEIRRARRRVEEERARLATAIESAADAVEIVDAAGVVHYVNPAFERMTGYGRDEVIGKSVSLLNDGGPGREQDGVREFQNALERGEVWSGRFTNGKKDGTQYVEDVTLSPVRDPSGSIRHFALVKRDMTERLRLESIAQAVDTMNNIGYIFSGVRHEIGNPVNSIIMTLHLIKAKLGTYDKADIERRIDLALAAADKVAYLLRSLKSFNMFEKPELEDVALADFMKTFLALVKEDFDKKGILIDTDIGAVTARVDPRALQQVMLNLFTNASDALTGRADPKIAVAVSRSAGSVRIRVRDNGCGISPERLRDLFKPFYTNKSHGTGLGLVIIKKMLTMMNGTVDISSAEGQGTTVDISVPAGDDVRASQQ